MVMTVIYLRKAVNLALFWHFLHRRDERFTAMGKKKVSYQ